MIRFVLDASVAAKWFLPPLGEPLVEEAIEVLQKLTMGEIRLTVPDLFWPEVGNILWKAARSSRISHGTAQESLLALRELGMNTVSTATLIPDALSIGLEFDRSVYDSVYVALAVMSDAPLLTADRRLANALGSSFPIRWLGSIN